MVEYKNHMIEPFQDGYIVFFGGDEFYFDNVETAKVFIDGIEAE